MSQAIASLFPAGRFSVEICHEAVSIRVARMKHVVLIEPKRVGRTDRTRSRICRVGHSQGSLFVWQRDIGACIAMRSELT